MNVYFADRQMNILGMASTGLPNSVTIIEDLKTEDIETGVSIFEFRIPFYKNTRLKAEAWAEVGNYVLRSSNGENELYQIIEAEIDTKRQEIYIYAEDDGMDLLNEVVGAYEADKAYPITHYIDKYASSAGFVIGINEVSDLTRKLSWEGESTATARIASIATQFDGCEVSYSFAVDGLTVTKKCINIYKERSRDNGVTMRLNREIDRIVTKKSIANIATALYCTGGTPDPETDEESGEVVEKTHITLEGYSYDDGDFYVDGALLKSRKALQRWSRVLWKDDDTSMSGGHIVKQYSYDTLSQKTLCANAITKLKSICDMEVNYEVEMPELPPNVIIGDRVNIVDDEGELYLSTRILKLETSVIEQSVKVTMGEFLLKSSSIHEKVIELAEQFAKNSQAVSRAAIVTEDAKNAAKIAQDKAFEAAQSAKVSESAVEELQAKYKELPEDTDLNNLKTTGFYIVSSNTIKNKPLWYSNTSATAWIHVENLNNGYLVIQRFYTCVVDAQFVIQRTLYCGDWCDWLIISGCTPWLDLTIASGFEAYGTNNEPKYRVNGNVVTVTGAVTPNAMVESNDNGISFATGIPMQFRPQMSMQFVCQGSDINRWLLSITTSGALTVSRYGSNDYVNILAGECLSFTASYSI